MKYINQLRYPHVPYPTAVDDPKNERMHNGTVKMAACGICCACMVVDQLTMEKFTLREGLQLSYDVKANHEPGTDMKRLGPALAEKFGLKYSTTSDVDEMIKALARGARVIANVGGDREGYVGVFTHGGHYVEVVSGTKKELCILDPSLSKHKFDEEGRKGKVRVEGNFCYCKPAVLDMDASNRTPRYYVFER